MATPVWKGTLSFGLLAIPVKLYTAARIHRIYGGTSEIMKYTIARTL